MKKSVAALLLIHLFAMQSQAQLQPSRIANVYTIDTKGGQLLIVNDSTQLVIESGSLKILKNFKHSALVYTSAITDFTYVASKGNDEKDIFLVNTLYSTLKNNTLNFLTKLNVETNTATVIPMEVRILGAKGKDIDFKVKYYAYDKKMNDIYFSDEKTILRYNIANNEFSILPVKIELNQSLEYADSGYLYILNRVDKPGEPSLHSFHFSSPDNIKSHPEIKLANFPSFYYSDDGKRRYIIQKPNVYLINANTLQQMPSSFVLHKLKGDIYGLNLGKGVVDINNNKGEMIDTLNLPYEAVRDIPMQDKLIITYNSNKPVEKNSNATVNSSNNLSNNSSPAAKDNFPYSIPFFRKWLTQYAKEREYLFLKYSNYSRCMETGTKSSCEYLISFDLKSRAEKQLKECLELKELLNKYPEIFLENIVTNEAATKKEFDNDEITYKKILRF